MPTPDYTRLPEPIKLEDTVATHDDEVQDERSIKKPAVDPDLIRLWAL